VTPNVRTEGGGAEGLAGGETRLGGQRADLAVDQFAQHPSHHAAVDGADHRVLGGDVTERAVVVDDPQLVVAALGVCSETVGGEGIGDRLDR
jgi:hypothetical protein